MDAAAERLLVVFKRHLVYLKTKLGECKIDDLVKGGLGKMILG